MTGHWEVLVHQAISFRVAAVVVLLEVCRQVEEILDSLAFLQMTCRSTVYRTTNFH